ncbi:MAG: hypothetical protein LKI92_12395 [Schleiferilactobacillus harbinensis]|jgi:hypothetical protein|nr:hypothetical protein [Schleiferilactobacillus harbinensis]MCI1914024.1 hypothetical protein [Schleiferilactobacillus harbinensis]
MQSFFQPRAYNLVILGAAILFTIGIISQIGNFALLILVGMLTVISVILTIIRTFKSKELIGVSLVILLVAYYSLLCAISLDPALSSVLSIFSRGALALFIVTMIATEIIDGKSVQTRKH